MKIHGMFLIEMCSLSDLVVSNLAHCVVDKLALID